MKDFSVNGQPFCHQKRDMKEKYGETVQVVNAPYLGRPYSRFPRILSESPTNFLPVSENKTPDTGPRKIGRLPRKITNNSRYYALQIAADDLLTKSTIPPQRFSRPE